MKNIENIKKAREEMKESVKLNIDNFISKNNYKDAFLLLVLSVEKMNENEKIEFIEYYCKKVDDLARQEQRNFFSTRL
jgi:hypothetical protein